MPTTTTTTTTNELTQLQRDLAKRVTNGFSISESADILEINRHTVMEWRRTIPAFDELLEQSVNDRNALNHERLEALTWNAISVLKQILTDDKASPSIRLRAAQCLFKHATATRAAAAQTAKQTQKIENVHNHAQSTVRLAPEPGRNTTCPCGSGLKFKRCCAQATPSVTQPETQAAATPNLN